jgi:hypothetical protein
MSRRLAASSAITDQGGERWTSRSCSSAISVSRRARGRHWPRRSLALYAAYLDDAGRDLRIVHAFPDAASMATHFEGAADRANAVATIIAPAGFEVYGNAPPTATEQLRREAHAAGVRLDLFADPLGGFLRDVRPATGAAG